MPAPDFVVLGHGTCQSNSNEAAGWIGSLDLREVELLEVKGTTLIVRGLDAFNGTPVLDIKVSMASLKRSR